MPDTSLLESFPNPSDELYVIEHVNEEFTSVCPVTGHPDFGRIVVRYTPRVRAQETAHPNGNERAGESGRGGCVELKSLKLYFQSFRDEGIYYEAATNVIRDDLVGLLDPVWLQVVTDWRGRGGIRSRIIASHGDVPAEWRHAPA